MEARMAIIDLYSKRQKKLRGEVPDVYRYDDLPETLMNQIAQIWSSVIGPSHSYTPAYTLYDTVVGSLRREYGVFSLASVRGVKTPEDELSTFFLGFASEEQQLDVVELTFRAIDGNARRTYYLGRGEPSRVVDEAIEELNGRFQEHGIGYQYTNGEIIRIDSQLIHSEVVKPALKLLNANGYEGPQQEFLAAHEHYRTGKMKEALNECLKSFESTMKAICDKRGWSYPKNGTAKDLIQTCFDNGLIPVFWQTQLSSLRTSLESSVPTGRNKLSGHGQGAVPTSVPDYLVGYMLHMTASSVVFLAEAEAALP
jgi:hypothetical protein